LEPDPEDEAMPVRHGPGQSDLAGLSGHELIVRKLGATVIEEFLHD
jgi:hypothetical protein